MRTLFGCKLGLTVRGVARANPPTVLGCFYSRHACYNSCARSEANGPKFALIITVGSVVGIFYRTLLGPVALEAEAVSGNLAFFAAIQTSLDFALIFHFQLMAKSRHKRMSPTSWASVQHTAMMLFRKGADLLVSVIIFVRRGRGTSTRRELQVYRPRNQRAIWASFSTSTSFLKSFLIVSFIELIFF